MKGRWTTSRRAIATAVGNASLRRALAAYCLFACGENAVWLAVSIFAYRQGGITAVGIVSVAQLLPAIAVAPLGATLGDRLAPARALTLGYAAQFLTNALLALAMFGASPIVTYAAAIAASCAITLTRPVHHALLPRLATTPEELTASNSLSSVVEGLGVMVGPALTALLVAVWGAAVVPALFAITCAGAALLATRVRVADATDRAPDGPHRTVHRIRDASTGFGELMRDRGTSLLVLLGGAQFLVAGFLDVLFVALAVEVLGRNEGTAGLLAAAGGIGALVGAVTAAVLIARTRMAPGIGGGMLVMGVGLALIPYSSTLAVMVALIGIAEAGRSFFDVAARTLLQRVVDAGVLARLFGVQESLVMVSLAIGAAAAPILASRFGIRGALLAATALVVLVGAAAWSTLRRLDDRAVVPDRERIELLLRTPLFSLLPQHELEQVAGRFEPVVVPAGTVVIREGDLGDHFYVVAEGEAAIEAGGRQVTTCGPGDYFGEIALLRDLPRTATVRTTTAARLLALGRRSFLAVVTGSPDGFAVVEAEIDRRLAELETD